jgi:hypothetical protein
MVRDLNEVERKTLREMIKMTASPISGRETIKWVSVALGAIGLLVLLATGPILLKPNSYSWWTIRRGPCHGWNSVSLRDHRGDFQLLSLGLLDTPFPGTYGSFGRSDSPGRQSAIQGCHRYAAIEIVGCEDEGSAYIFAVEDNRSLLLKGQRFVPAKEDMPWLAATFSIVRSSDGKLWIGVFFHW